MNGSMTVIGTNDIDEYYEMDSIPVMGDKVICRFLENRVGGMLGNAASVYAGYGRRTCMIDCINGGPQTRALKAELEKYGVDTSHFSIDESLPDPKCLIMLKDGERVIFVMAKKKKDLRLSQEQRTAIAGADFIYSTLSELKSFAEEEGIFDLIFYSGAKLVFDMESGTLSDTDTDFEILKKTCILFINSGSDEKMRKLYGDNYVQKLSQAGCIIVLTKGKDGCAVCAKGEEPVSIPGHRVKVVDTTGAGDTFNASFVYGYSKGWPLKDCGEFANAAAARAIGFMGARSGVAGEEEIRRYRKELCKEDLCKDISHKEGC